MKKTILLFGIIALAIVTLFVGCKKQSSSNAVNPTSSSVKSASLEKIENDLRIINAKYVHTGPYVHKTTKPNGWLVAGADLVAGVGMGTRVWSWCATGWGGLLAGACIVGAAACASASAWDVHAGTPNSGNHGNQLQAIIDNVGHYTVPNPYNNPYEGRGQLHNLKVKALCQQTGTVQLNYSTLTFDSSSLAQIDLDAFYADSTHIGYGIAAFVNSSNIINQQTGELDYNPMISEYFGDDSTMYSIMTLFYDAFNQISDDSTAMAFLNDYEHYFLDPNVSITDAQRYGLLNGLAIGKYSLAMWADALKY